MMIVLLPLVRRWLGPALVALVVMISYQWIVAPILNDLRADWDFLHLARQAQIEAWHRQQQQSSAEPRPSPPNPSPAPK